MKIIRKEIVLSAVLGFIVVVSPDIVTDGPQIIWRDPFFLFRRTETTNLQFYFTLIGLFSVGLILSVIFPDKWLYIGLAAIVIVPVFAALDIILHPTSHTLWFIEIFMYMLMDIPAILGALLGMRIRNRGKTSFEQNYLNSVRRN